MSRSIVRTARPMLSLSLLVVLTGCYYYAPVERPTRTDPTQLVRAELPSPSDMAMSNDVVVRSVVRVEGHPIEWRDDALLLRARTIFQSGNRSFTPPRGETMLLSRSAMSELAERRIDAGRTAMLVGGVAVGGAGLAALLFGGEAGGADSESPDADTGDRESRKLRFVLPFPFGGGG